MMFDRKKQLFIKQIKFTRRALECQPIISLELGGCVNQSDHSIPISSTSNWRVAFGGIIPPAPVDPYAYSGGQTKVAFSPIDICKKNKMRVGGIKKN